MEIYDDLALQVQMMDWLKLRLKELSGERTGMIHMTELIYCLTSSFLKRVAIEEVQETDGAALRMGFGIGLEKLIIPPEMRAQPKIKDGIAYSPDFWRDLGKNRLNEMKVTSMGTKRVDSNDLPDTWMYQMKGYCYAEGLTEYGLFILMVINYSPRPRFDPQVRGKRFIFTPQELQENWDWLVWRRNALTEALATNVMPTPGRFCFDWECKDWDCKFRKVCGK